MARHKRQKRFEMESMNIGLYFSEEAEIAFKCEFGQTNLSKLFDYKKSEKVKLTRYEIFGFDPDDIDNLYGNKPFYNTLTSPEKVLEGKKSSKYSWGDEILGYNQKKMLEQQTPKAQKLKIIKQAQERVNRFQKAQQRRNQLQKVSHTRLIIKYRKKFSRRGKRIKMEFVDMVRKLIKQRNKFWFTYIVVSQLYYILIQKTQVSKNHSECFKQNYIGEEKLQSQEKTKIKSSTACCKFFLILKQFFQEQWRFIIHVKLKKVRKMQRELFHQYCENTTCLRQQLKRLKQLYGAVNIISKKQFSSVIKVQKHMIKYFKCRRAFKYDLRKQFNKLEHPDIWSQYGLDKKQLHQKLKMMGIKRQILQSLADTDKKDIIINNYLKYCTRKYHKQFEKQEGEENNANKTKQHHKLLMIPNKNESIRMVKELLILSMGKDNCKFIQRKNSKQTGVQQGIMRKSIIRKRRRKGLSKRKSTKIHR